MYIVLEVNWLPFSHQHLHVWCRNFVRGFFWRKSNKIWGKNDWYNILWFIRHVILCNIILYYPVYFFCCSCLSNHSKMLFHVIFLQWFSLNSHLNITICNFSSYSIWGYWIFIINVNIVWFDQLIIRWLFHQIISRACCPCYLWLWTCKFSCNKWVLKLCTIWEFIREIIILKIDIDVMLTTCSLAFALIRLR